MDLEDVVFIALCDFSICSAFMNVLAQKLNDYWQEKTNTTDSAPTV